MSEEPSSIGKTFGLSVLIGAYVGIGLQLIMTLWDEPIDRSEWWAIPVLVVVYGLLATPFVALGLALFGLPVTHLLRRRAREWWIGAVALLWGAIAGKLTFYAIDQLIFFGAYKIDAIAFLDLGIVYGVPTALAWWLLHRRELTKV